MSTLTRLMNSGRERFRIARLVDGANAAATEARCAVGDGRRMLRIVGE